MRIAARMRKTIAPGAFRWYVADILDGVGMVSPSALLSLRTGHH